MKRYIVYLCLIVLATFIGVVACTEREAVLSLGSAVRSIHYNGNPYVNQLHESRTPYSLGIDGFVMQSDMIVTGQIVSEESSQPYPYKGDWNGRKVKVYHLQITDIVYQSARTGGYKPGDTVKWAIIENGSSVTFEVFQGDSYIAFLRLAQYHTDWFRSLENGLGRISDKTQEVADHEVFGNMPVSAIVKELQRSIAGLLRVSPKFDTTQFADLSKGTVSLIGFIPTAEMPVELSELVGSDQDGIILMPHMRPNGVVLIQGVLLNGTFYFDFDIVAPMDSVGYLGLKFHGIPQALKYVTLGSMILN